MNFALLNRVISIVTGIAILSILLVLVLNVLQKPAPVPVDSPENLCPSITPWTVDLEISGNTRLTMTIYCEEDPAIALNLLESK